MNRFKRSTLLPAVLLTLACGTARDTTVADAPSTAATRASLVIEVVPNPIEARRVSGDTYDFPFTIALRETNGVRVEINRVSIDVLALGTVSAYRKTYDRNEIARRGYPTSVAAGGELRYTFTPRKEVPDDRLFGGVSAQLVAEGTDANGNPVSATTSVTVSR